MKIKKFTAKNYRIALDMIKTEFGDNAVILSTNEKKGKESYVEITAAIDYDDMLFRKDKSAGVETPFTQQNFALSNASSLYRNNETIQTNSLKQDIKGKHEEKVKVTISNDPCLLSDLKKNTLNLLKKESVKINNSPKKGANPENLDNKALSYKNNIETKPKTKDCKVIMLVGPTGVGKTTTVAKLSANAIKEGKKVGLISLDNYRIGAIEQIRIYAKIMGIPLYTASGLDILKDGITRFINNKDLIFIDTMGRNPKDEAYIKSLRESCLINLPIELHLLISANSDYGFVVESLMFYNELPISCIGLTKVDEAVRFDNIQSLIRSCGKPIAYITTGQKVPDDIQFTLSNDTSISLNMRMNTC